MNATAPVSGLIEILNKAGPPKSSVAILNIKDDKVEQKAIKPPKDKSLGSDSYLHKEGAIPSYLSTLVNIQKEYVVAPADSNQVKGQKAAYVDAFAKTKSENLLVALYAQIEVAALGIALMANGVTKDEMKDLQAQSMAQARQQNENQIRDTMSTAVTLEMAGSPKPKKLAATLKLLDKVLDKLIKQGKLLGREYSSQELAQMKLDALQSLKDKMREEKLLLDDQLNKKLVNQLGILKA